MAEIVNKYRYTVTDRMGEKTVFPLGESKLQLTWEREDDNVAAYNTELNGKILFTRDDYTRLYNLERTIYRCSLITILVERLDCYGKWAFMFIGQINLNNGDWDLDNCTVEVSITTFDQYSCLDVGMDDDINLFDIATRYTATTIDPRVTIEKRNCSLHTSCDTVYSWCGTGAPEDGYWRVTSYIFSNDELIDRCTGSSQWAREKLIVPTSEFVDSSWNFLSNDGTNTTYVRYVTLSNVTYTDPPNGYGAYTMTSDIVGDNTATAIKNIPNGLWLGDVLTKFITIGCPSYQVVSNFFDINADPNPRPGRLFAETVTANINSPTAKTVQLLSVTSNIYIKAGVVLWMDDVNYRVVSVQYATVSAGRYNATVVLTTQPPVGVRTVNYRVYEQQVSPNYVTGLSSMTSGVLVFQKSDVKRPNSVNKATKMEVSGSDFLKWLIEMFQLEYRVDGTTFRLEHVSWFQRPTGIDTTTIPLSNYTKKSRKYSYTADALPSKETYQFMEASNADFVGVPIIYNSDCVTKEAKKQIVEHVVDNVTTDVEYVISNPSSESKKIDDSGIVIMSCRRTDTSWIINSMPGILDIQRLNNPFSWAILQDSYHRHKRPFRNGVMNRQQTTFTTVIPTKVGSTITIPLCCGTAFDPFATVKTELGEGVVDKAAYILNGEALELDIKYVADDGLITNTPPIATPVEAYTYVNTPVYIPIGASFSDADGDIVRPSLGNGLPSHGIASLVTYNGDSNYIYYVPESGYVGTDFIYFRGMDIYGEYSNQSYVRLTIRASNQPPTAVTDTYIVEYNTALNVSAANGLLANDTDDYTPRANLGVIGNSTPSSGSVVVNANGSFVYTPALNYTGPATFTYTVQDGGGLTSVGTVNLTIRNLSGPVARADAYNTSMGGLTFWASGIGVLANDYSPNAGLRIYSPIGTYPVTYTTTQGYTISMDSDGAFRYTRPSGFSGTDTFLYTCTDNTGAQNSATVTINVFPPVYIRLVRSNVTPGVSTVVRCDSGSGPTMTQRIRKSTADYTLYFYSDAEGTVPINVSAFGLILNFKRVTYDNINNITYTGTWSQTVPTSATASYLIWPDSVTAYSETECMVGSGGMGNAIFDESYVVTLDNGSNYYVIS